MQNHANTAAEFNMLCKNTQNERPQRYPPLQYSIEHSQNACKTMQILQRKLICCAKIRKMSGRRPKKNRSLGIQYYISRGNRRAAGAKFSEFGVIDLDF